MRKLRVYGNRKFLVEPTEETVHREEKRPGVEKVDTVRIPGLVKYRT